MADTDVITFRVRGKAISQGSKNPVVPTYKDGTPVRRHKEDCPFYMAKGKPDFICGCPVMVNAIEDNAAELGPWRDQVAMRAREAMNGRDPLEGAVNVAFTFFRTRPANHYGTGKNCKVLKQDAPAMPAVAPDGLKLARAVEDAMSGIVYEDDARIVNEWVAKRYVNRWEDPYVVVAVRRATVQTVAEGRAAGAIPHAEEEFGQIGLLDTLSV